MMPYSSAGKAAQPVLISACLLGASCRYDGQARPCAAVIDFARTHDVIPVCPELLGGLPAPRSASEVDTASDTLRVISVEGRDRTEAFRNGAAKTVEVAREQGCTLAILKSKSPSCGCHRIYDGTFTGTLVEGCGVTAAALLDAGIHVIDEDDLARDGAD